MKTIITGGAGFIGSNLVNCLLGEDDIELIDNFSTGDLRFLDKNANDLKIHHIDLSSDSLTKIQDVFSGADRVFHLAANADVRGGWQDSTRDIQQNIIATSNVAEAARRSSVPEVIFASTGCVYGDGLTIPTSENEQFPNQTSLYGMSKTAAEGILSSYAAQGAFKATSFRFVSVLGRNYHHGHVVDFIRKLQTNPNVLNILGNGEQKKSYVHVDDCIEAFLNLRSMHAFDTFNIGHNYFISIKESASLIAESLHLSPKMQFGSEPRGWVGDNPFTFLDIAKANSYGWEPTHSIEESLEETVQFIMDNKWVIDKRDYRD